MEITQQEQKALKPTMNQMEHLHPTPISLMFQLTLLFWGQSNLDSKNFACRRRKAVSTEQHPLLWYHSFVTFFLIIFTLLISRTELEEEDFVHLWACVSRSAEVSEKWRVQSAYVTAITNYRNVCSLEYQKQYTAISALAPQFTLIHE